jgi:CDP-diacylglycerol--serine O-phosphatidyltransferase
MRKGKGKRRIKRGIYILPSIFTSLGLFCGFYSITASIKLSFVNASWAIILATAFDAIDGRIARLTNSVSKFGEHYDSLVDVISFGVAPGVLIYNWALQPFGRWGWLATFLYLICVALRLARFTAQSKSLGNRYFQGMPCPPAALMIASTVIFMYNLGIAEIKNVAIPLLICMLAMLMVSTLRYHSFKDFINSLLWRTSVFPFFRGGDLHYFRPYWIFFLYEEKKVAKEDVRRKKGLLEYLNI